MWLLACMWLAPIALTPEPLGHRVRHSAARPCIRLSEQPADKREPWTDLFQRLRSPELGTALGSALLLALVANRLGTEDLLNSQSRADLIATIGPVLLTLDALANLDITPREPEPVPIRGATVNWLDPSVRVARRVALAKRRVAHSAQGQLTLAMPSRAWRGPQAQRTFPGVSTPDASSALIGER